MKFFIISEGGDGAGLALRLQEEGHDVHIWIRDDEASANCKGLLKVDPDFQITEDTTIISDCTGSGVLCDAYRDAGLNVLGGSLLADKLECDREYAASIFKQVGIKTPKTKYFTDWDKAREYVEATSERLVFKPEGDLSGVVPSYVSSDQGDMLAMLEFYKNQQPTTVPAFALQYFLEGTCVSTECWFNGHDFIQPFNHTIERKQLMNGDLGPSGGCTGNVVWACEEECPICNETVVKLEEYLREIHYVGPIDVNAVVADDGVFALEFTPRFGYDATPTLLCALLATELGVFLAAVADGTCGEMPLFPGFAVGIKLTVPPWPSEKFVGAEGLPVRGLKNLERFYPYNLMKGEGKDYLTSGGYGITGVVLGNGPTIDEAFETAEKLAGKIKLPDKQYRTDLAEVCKKDYRRLTAFARKEMA